MAWCRPDGRMPVLSQSPGKRSLLILRVASMRRNWSVPCIGDGSGLPMPRRRTFASASCLRSLDADCAPASCLRLSATPALGTWAAPHGYIDSRACTSPGREGGLPGHRSERQAPRRIPPAIVRAVAAEPPSERSVFGEPDQRGASHGKLETRPHGEPDRRVARDGSGTPLPRIFTGGVGCRPETPNGKLPSAHCAGRR